LPEKVQGKKVLLSGTALGRSYFTWIAAIYLNLPNPA
jgi:hypothetical protein